MMLKEPVSDSVVRRLPRYYRYLSELERAGVERTSSQALATQLGSTASQIRQDLNCFGGFGHQGYGYHVSDLRTQLGRIIGLEQCMPAVLIGAGHLGSVIAVNIDFPAYGFYLTGIFDIVPTVCGQVLGGLTVQHMTQLSDFCEQVHPAAAVLCIPEHAAQAVSRDREKRSRRLRGDDDRHRAAARDGARGALKVSDDRGQRRGSFQGRGW